VAVDHYENFPVASWLVPSRLRGAVVAIYRFARTADDIADEGDALPAARLAALEHHERMLDRIERGERPAQAPFDALADAVREHSLDVGLLRALLSAFRQDVVKQRYANYAELDDYCTRSANPVGRLLLQLYGEGGSESLQQADAVCTGLQLANFWQDVAIDWAKGRVYLPQDELARFGVSERHIASGTCDNGWQALMQFQTARAAGLLARGKPLARRLPMRLALELRMVIAGGSRICARIDAVHGDVFRHRPQLGRRDWTAMSLAALRR
jgi:squalene synthase HpnC